MEILSSFLIFIAIFSWCLLVLSNGNTQNIQEKSVKKVYACCCDCQCWNVRRSFTRNGLFTNRFNAMISFEFTYTLVRLYAFARDCISMGEHLTFIAIYSAMWIVSERFIDLFENFERYKFSKGISIFGIVANRKLCRLFFIVFIYQTIVFFLFFSSVFDDIIFYFNVEILNYSTFLWTWHSTISSFWGSSMRRKIQ